MVGSVSIAYIYEPWAIINIAQGFVLCAKNVFVVTVLTIWICLVNNTDNSRLFHGYNHVQLRLIPAIEPERIL